MHAMHAIQSTVEQWRTVRLTHRTYTKQRVTAITSVGQIVTLRVMADTTRTLPRAEAIGGPEIVRYVRELTYKQSIDLWNSTWDWVDDLAD